MIIQGTITVKTRTGEENRYFQAKENHMFNRQDLPTPNQNYLLF